MSKVNVLGVEMSHEEARNLVKVITDPANGVYFSFLNRLYALNEKKILKHDPDKDGTHAEGVLKGKNLQILLETEEIRTCATRQLGQS